MRWCARCENCRWVCENNQDRPWEGVHACTCGGAGAPCPICDATDDLTVPEMPEDFQADVVNKDWSDDVTPRIPKNTGHDAEEPNRQEIEHFGSCPYCGALIDMRDLAQIMEHAHGQEIQEIETPPLES
jgi:hypothetical protein